MNAELVFKKLRIIMKDNIILDKSISFAIRVVNMYKYLCDEKHEYILSKQFVRAGTSIGANIHEAVNGQSRKDFLSKMYIAFNSAFCILHS